MRRHTSNDKRRERARAAWGAELSGVQSVVDVFVAYCCGEVKLLPWAEMEELHPESGTIAQGLAALNRAGYLTINSQPRVNGVPSDDPTFGWGGKGGYVYQKAYGERGWGCREQPKAVGRACMWMGVVHGRAAA